MVLVVCGTIEVSVNRFGRRAPLIGKMPECLYLLILILYLYLLPCETPSVDDIDETSE
jgi:hypothetical protein